jgi:hypothetical protein
MQLTKEKSVHGNFDLKNVSVSLIPPPKSVPVSLSITDLEEFRASRHIVSASAHGLEVICGGSCETGAQ